jgi:hypothetical protein
MSNEESSQLMTNLDFRGKIKVAIQKLVYKLQNETPPPMPGRAVQNWARDASMGTGADQAAMQLQPGVVMHPAVQEHGAAIDDGNLQFAVEKTVERLIV